MGNVRSVWNQRNLDFLDKAKAVIFKIDGQNRKVTVPTGSNFDFSAGTGTITLAAGTVSAASIASNSLVGTQVGSAADANVIGAIPVLHRIDIADGVTGDVDVVLTHKTKITDVWVVNNVTTAGGVANTYTVKNGTNAISDAMSVDGKAQYAVIRCASLDLSKADIAAAGTLRVTRTKAGGTIGATVYVLGVRVA